MRFWIYKNNLAGGPAGYWGDWPSAFRKKGPVGWGGHYSTTSAEVSRYLDEVISAGDVVVAYQTDRKVVIGFLRVEQLKPTRRGGSSGLELQLQPIHLLDPPWKIHEHKRGTPLESSSAVNGRVMLRELDGDAMKALVSLTGAPARVLQGRQPPGGWKPVR
ncbi:MAG TPA: hypothetical protein VF364_13250 [Candidatus Limnocylindria bacterium]